MLSTGTSSPQTQLVGQHTLQDVKPTVSLDEGLRLLHLLEELCVSNNARRVPDLATRFVEARDAAHNRALRHVGEVGDVAERLCGQSYS